MVPPFKNIVNKLVLAIVVVWSSGLSPRAIAQSIVRIDKHLYSETADAAADISAAELTARRGHKRILLEFGGNWCADCQVLNYYYHQSPNAELLAKYYVVVRVDIGHMDHNLEIARKYHVPVSKGVPALALLDAHGNLLYAEREKEFEHVNPEAITAFLTKWKT
jgi:thiol:disulfide interchange protein